MNGHLFLLERVLSDREALYFEKPYFKLMILKIEYYPKKNSFRLNLEYPMVQLVHCCLFYKSKHSCSGTLQINLILYNMKFFLTFKKKL